MLIKSHIIKWFICTVFVSSILPFTYYVDANGSDSNDCLSHVQSCLTIQRAINKATSGDDILVSPGLYLENIIIDKGVIIRSLNFYESVTIDGSSTNHSAVSVNNILEQIDVEIDGIIITGGEAVGGGIYLPNGNLYLKQTVVTKNSSIGHGGGIFVGALASLQLENSLVVYNETGSGNTFGAGIYADGGSVTMINSIVFFNRRKNSDGINFNLNGYSGSIQDEFNVTYSNIEGESSWVPIGQGNLSTNPLFLDPNNNNFMLQEYSPCIDAGIEIQGMDYYGLAPDIGAYEFRDVLLGDVVSDGLINISDIIRIIAIILETHIPTNHEFLVADINTDFVVDILDVLQIVQIIIDN